MKPEFSEVLLPSGKTKMFTTTNEALLSSKSRSCSLTKWLAIFSFIFGLFALAIITTSLIVRYEAKMVQYDARISALEEEFGLFFEQFETTRTLENVRELMEEDEEGFPIEDDHEQIADSGSYEEDDVQSILFPIIRDRTEEELKKDEELGKIVFGVGQKKILLEMINSGIPGITIDVSGSRD